MNFRRSQKKSGSVTIRPVVGSKAAKFQVCGKGLTEGFAYSQNMIFLQFPREMVKGLAAFQDDDDDVLDPVTFIFDGPSKANVDFHHVRTPTKHCLYAGYQVTEPGTYYISIYYYGVLVNGIPYRAQIRDVEDISKASRVQVRGDALKSVLEGEKSTFKISTKYSGVGTLGVTITGPCVVRMSCTSIGIHCTKISFTPPQPGYYFINIKFNGFHIPGSPFRTECHCVCDTPPSADAPPLPPDNGVRRRPWVFV